jgi:hypothetical protein
MERMKASLNLLIILGAAIIVTVVFYFLNALVFSSYRNFIPTDAFFLEGLVMMFLGFLFLLGRGGINLWSVKAAILAAVAGAVYKNEGIGPNEIMRRDRWKPEGFIRFSLVLILAGVLMLLVYFLS